MAYTSIDDPSAHFQATLWTGDGNDNKQITNAGNSDLKPDLIWLKDRTQAESPAIFDSTRGASVRLQPNSTGAESTESATQKSFTTDGFTVGTSGSVNNGSNPDNYVAWQWVANGGTTASNSVGDIDSVVQANTDAGFSIVTYTGNGSQDQTIGHGLGAVPKMILFKNRSNAAYWYVYHVDTGNDTMMYLNLTNAAQSLSSQFSTPTTTTFNVSNENSTFNGYNSSSQTYVAYVFADVQGYSKFDKYTGNGNSNGPFVYTGFKPAFVMIKRTDSTGGWTIYDTKRGFNGNNYELFPHSAEAEYTGTSYFEADMLSNSFKLRLTDGQINATSGTYVYAAFAENPFVTSTGIMGTAR